MCWKKKETNGDDVKQHHSDNPIESDLTENDATCPVHPGKEKQDQMEEEGGATYCSWDRGEIYRNHFKSGIYVCSSCGYELFSSGQKFKHSSPWPSFHETIHKDSVKKKKMDSSAYKVYCGKCETPLGHEFLDEDPFNKSRF